jgi:hypothetical protein
MIQEGFTWGGEVECDNAKRWRYVQAATKFCNSQQANQIAALCKLWNQLRYICQATGQSLMSFII